MKFEFANYGKTLGTRHLGKIVRVDLLSTIENNNNKIIILDFANVDLVNNSFADEVFGKLTRDIGLEKLKTNTTFINVDPFVEMCILKAIRQRIKDS